MVTLLITILYAVMLMPVSYVGGGSQLTVIITLDSLTAVITTVRFSGALGPHFSSARARSLVFQQSILIHVNIIEAIGLAHHLKESLCLFR